MGSQSSMVGSSRAALTLSLQRFLSLGLTWRNPHSVISLYTRPSEVNHWPPITLSPVTNIPLTLLIQDEPVPLQAGYCQQGLQRWVGHQLAVLYLDILGRHNQGPLSVRSLCHCTSYGPIVCRWSKWWRLIPHSYGIMHRDTFLIYPVHPGQHPISWTLSCSYWLGSLSFPLHPSKL